MASKEMTEAQMVNLVRNALLVAGHEMGSDGDHWPVIKATVLDVMKDWENFKTEQNVGLEVKRHYEAMVLELRDLMKTSPDELKPHIEKTIATIEDVCSASFDPVDRANLYMTEESIPPHLKRAESIIKTLETEHE